MNDNKKVILQMGNLEKCFSCILDPVAHKGSVLIEGSHSQMAKPKTLRAFTLRNYWRAINHSREQSGARDLNYMIT